MSAIFIHQGDAIDYVAENDLKAGSVVVQGNLLGVTVRSIPAGHLGAVQVRGVFDFYRDPGVVIPAGSRIFWDVTAKKATADDNSGANPYLGKSIRESSETETILRVRLDQ